MSLKLYNEDKDRTLSLEMDLNDKTLYLEAEGDSGNWLYSVEADIDMVRAIRDGLLTLEQAQEYIDQSGCAGDLKDFQEIIVKATQLKWIK